METTIYIMYFKDPPKVFRVSPTLKSLDPRPHHEKTPNRKQKPQEANRWRSKSDHKSGSACGDPDWYRQQRVKGCTGGMQFSAFGSEGLEFGLEDWVGVWSPKCVAKSS